MMQPFDSAEYGVPAGLAPGTTAAGGTDLGGPLSIWPGLAVKRGDDQPCRVIGRDLPGRAQDADAGVTAGIAGDARHLAGGWCLPVPGAGSPASHDHAAPGSLTRWPCMLRMDAARAGLSCLIVQRRPSALRAVSRIRCGDAGPAPAGDAPELPGASPVRRRA